MTVTVDQLKTLWHHGGTINRGDDYSPITQDDLAALDIDTDDNGYPLDNQWQVLADQFNGETAGEVYSSAQHNVLEAIEDSVKTIRDAETARDDLIRQAITEGVPVITIAERASLSRARIYQIRDGRR
ncbi:hypothetical protein [Streptomyces sp. NPDC057580]|uniref:hypothetical protein n=1 Tax=Streptomyces sp. NPDC057580 TaxID=3346173 RepID=UPI003694CFF4